MYEKHNESIDKSVHNISVASMSQVDLDNIEESPPFPLNFKEMRSILFTLIKSGLPTSVTYLTNFLTSLVCLRFVGIYGNPNELAGASLGNTFGNVLCTGILFSVNQGFAVIASQLYGAKKFKEIGTLYQRNLCVISALAIPLIIMMVFGDRVLIACGLNYEVSINTGIYMRHIIPSLIGLMIFDCTKFYLIAQERFFFQGIVQGIMSIVHVFLCMLFVDHLGLSVRGAGIAKSITDVTSAVILVSYINFSGVLKKCWVPWSKECLKRWGEHLKSTLVIGANLYVEWITYEISIFIASGTNNEFVIGAHGVAISLTIGFFTLGLGNSAAMQAYLGNSVGEGYKYKAQKFMMGGLFMNLVYSITMAAIMLFLNRQIAELFSHDETTIGILRNIIYIYCPAHFADTAVNHLSGVVRTVGREHEVLINFITAYIVIGLNCQWIFGLVLGYGYVGIWLSITLGMYIMLVAMLLKVIKMDWDQVLVDVGHKVAFHGGQNDENTKFLDGSNS